jgi:hypothetical protein
MPLLHVPAYCSIGPCVAEATRWFEAGDRTFYLCEEHAEAFSPGDDTVSWPDPETGRIYTEELAVYACSDECTECNS